MLLENKHQNQKVSTEKFALFHLYIFTLNAKFRPWLLLILSHLSQLEQLEWLLPLLWQKLGVFVGRQLQAVFIKEFLLNFYFREM